MRVLSIAGSDPSSGAGIQGDIKTFNILGAYGLSVITAVTSQNTSGFFDVEPVSPSLVRSQISHILEDFEISAIKIGMVYDKQTVKVINSELREIKIPIILDPIFKSTTGGILQREDTFLDFKKLLVPLAYVITPNVIEAEKISGINIRNQKDLKTAARKIQKIGSKNVVIKGGHFSKGNKVSDLLLCENKFNSFSHNRMRFESHGGGCTFSAALCVGIGRGKKLVDAVDFARTFTLESMKNAVKAGKVIPIVKQRKVDNIENQLLLAISKFSSINGIYSYIPECQTNFVYSVSNPASIDDILGVEGRIVRTGKSVTVAGHLKYGGSKHVASAVLEMRKKFPSIRSALNIKYDKKIIKKAKIKKLRISSYDRNLEPSDARDMEGRTISWGISTATHGKKTPPDLVFHKGDFGKEAMILIFGKNPAEVVAKLVKIVKIHPLT